MGRVLAVQAILRRGGRRARRHMGSRRALLAAQPLPGRVAAAPVRPARRRASSARWDELVAANPDGGQILQTRAWGEFKRAHRWPPRYLVSRNGPVGRGPDAPAHRSRARRARLRAQRARASRPSRSCRPVLDGLRATRRIARSRSRSSRRSSRATRRSPRCATWDSRSHVTTCRSAGRRSSWTSGPTRTRCSRRSSRSAATTSASRSGAA